MINGWAIVSGIKSVVSCSNLDRHSNQLKHDASDNDRRSQNQYENIISFLIVLVHFYIYAHQFKISQRYTQYSMHLVMSRDEGTD